jgi:hypothetical protein
MRPGRSPRKCPKSLVGRQGLEPWTDGLSANEDPRSPTRRRRGRKNHYGSQSERGIRVVPLFYSLIESAKLTRVEPRAYLGEAARRAIRNPGTVTLARDFK